MQVYPDYEPEMDMDDEYAGYRRRGLGFKSTRSCPDHLLDVAEQNQVSAYYAKKSTEHKDKINATNN